MSNRNVTPEEYEAQQQTLKKIEGGQSIDDYLFDLMSSLELLYISFDYGNRVIGVSDFDGDLDIEGETLQYVLEQRAEQLRETKQEQAAHKRIAELEYENKALRKVFDATWEALDGLYGAWPGEVIPVTLLPEDRQQLFNKLLEVVGKTDVVEMLGEER